VTEQALTVPVSTAGQQAAASRWSGAFLPRLLTGLAILLAWEVVVRGLAPAYVAKPSTVLLAIPSVIVDHAFLQALGATLWAVTEVEPHSLTVLNNLVAKPPQERDAKLARAAIEALRAPFSVLDRALAATGFLVGGRFTVADIGVAEVCRYAMPAPELFEAAPRVKAWLAACHARPAFKAMWAKRELEPA
jgi:hypothetical protein